MALRTRLAVLLPLGVLLAAITYFSAAVASSNQKLPSAAWEDHFSKGRLDSSRWVMGRGGAPGYRPYDHAGYYQANRVSVEGGYLVLRLTQEKGVVDGNPDAVISRGALIYTKETYGYGAYEWRMRMSSTASSPTHVGAPVSGSVSAGFVYVNNSETEIDLEFAGHLPGWLFMVNWHNPTPSSGPTDNQSTVSTRWTPDISSRFRTYKFIWEPGSITFYVDGVFQTQHVTNVPSAPAHFMINHWGTNNPWFGGTATLGTTRYFYVDWVRHTPLP